MAETISTNISPLDEAAALDYLRREGRIEAASITALGKAWGWKRERTSKALIRWEGAGRIEREEGTGGNVIIRIPEAVPAPVPAGNPGVPALIVEKPAGVPAPLMERPAWHTIEHPGVKSETTSPGWWNAAGRIIVGVLLVAVGVTIAVTSMEANSWYGHSLTTDVAAGDIFARLSVLAEIAACILPTANRFYWEDGSWWTLIKGTAMMVVALVVVFFAASGFVVTNLSGATEAKAERTTPTVITAQRALDDAKTARDRECVKVGPICRQREDAVIDRQGKLDEAKAEVRVGADPQAEAFHVTPNTLRTAKAGVMVLMCLAAGYIISLGWGLVFVRRRTTASARR
jgi:hypothetical protein